MRARILGISLVLLTSITFAANLEFLDHFNKHESDSLRLTFRLVPAEEGGSRKPTPGEVADYSMKVWPTAFNKDGSHIYDFFPLLKDSAKVVEFDPDTATATFEVPYANVLRITEDSLKSEEELPSGDYPHLQRLALESKKGILKVGLKVLLYHKDSISSGAMPLSAPLIEQGKAHTLGSDTFNYKVEIRGALISGSSGTKR